ncbi:MAG TPA: Spy/CpxP family protein refolding chaperone [Gammaproteobacteria bacterium]|nr:Spy/CpxP family protein refolding chaperone [Gammaproteobacteria bacterium]
MKLSTRIITAAMLVAGSSTAVYAVSKHGDWHMTPEEKAEFVTDRVTKKLSLDTTQRQNFNDLASLVAGIVAEARASKSEQMEELSALIQAPNFDQARALELVREKTGMVEENAPQVIASLAVFLDSLNSEQKQQLEEFIEHRHQHDGHYRKH